MKKFSYVEIIIIILAAIVVACIFYILARRSEDIGKELELPCRDRSEGAPDSHFSLSLNAGAPPEEIVIRYSHSKPRIHTNRVSGSFLWRIKRFFARVDLMTTILGSLPRIIGLIIRYIRQFFRI